MGLLRSKEKQPVLMFCENRLIKREKLPILGFFLISTDTLGAWFRFRKFLQKVKGFKGRLWLPIDERYALPISPYADSYYSPSEMKQLTNKDEVAEASLNFTSTRTDQENRKSHFADFMAIAVMGVVIVLIIYAVLVAAGKVDFGALFRGFAGG